MANRYPGPRLSLQPNQQLHTWERCGICVWMQIKHIYLHGTKACTMWLVNSTQTTGLVSCLQTLHSYADFCLKSWTPTHNSKQGVSPGCQVLPPLSHQHALYCKARANMETYHRQLHQSLAHYSKWAEQKRKLFLMWNRVLAVSIGTNPTDWIIPHRFNPDTPDETR